MKWVWLKHQSMCSHLIVIIKFKLASLYWNVEAVAVSYIAIVAAIKAATLCYTKAKEPPRTNVITAPLLWNLLFSKAYWTAQYFPAAPSEAALHGAAAPWLYSIAPHQLPLWIFFNTRQVLFGTCVCVILSWTLSWSWTKIHQQGTKLEVIGLSVLKP